MQAHLVRAAEVKKAIEWIMCNLDGHYAADTVAAAIALGSASATETVEESDGENQLSPFFPYSPQRNASKGKGNDTASPSNISRNFR